MSKLTTQDKLNIVELAKSGMSQIDISKMYSISTNTVSTVLGRAKHGDNLSGTSSKRRLSKDEIKNLIDDLKNRDETGATIVQLAVKYGVVEHTICRYIEKYSLQSKKEHTYKLSNEQKQSIYEASINGTSAVELSGEFGVSVNTIYKVVRELRESNEQTANTVKLIAEQFNTELSSLIDCTFISNIDKSMLSESTAKFVDDMERKRNRLFELYKEYSIELIDYAENVDTVSELVRAEMEEKYRYLQSKFERRVS